MEKIDFVLIWVDGGDKNWLNEKNKYSPTKKDISNSENRFRDWDILKYWFRGVEKYAPWVNNIYFVTWGHLPKWLNTNNPKLKIINHKDYIPKEYLPTFNSHTIELNLHRIKGLTDKFVYFNDDMFIINHVEKEDYFKNGNPCLPFYETVNIPNINNQFSKICYNNVEILNNEFNKREFYKNHLLKILNIKNGVSHVIQSILLYPYPEFTGIGITHGGSPMVKANYSHLWKKYHNKFNNTCLHKFRNYDKDINQYVIKDYSILNGKFNVKKSNFIKLINVESTNQIPLIKKILFDKKTKEICINDNISNEKEYDQIIQQIQKILLEKFPKKSTFEK